MASAPRVVQLFPSDPRSPIPEAVRLDDVVYAHATSPADPVTGRMPEGLVPQMAQALQNMRVVLERAGASLDNVARVTGYTTRVEERDAMYEPWDALFPDPSDRPAFKVLGTPLPPGVLVQLDMLALVGERRRRIDIPGVTARDPTVIVGNWVFSSRLHGTDPSTGETPESAEGQVKHAFDNVRRLIEIAGGTTRNITQITAFYRDTANVKIAEQYLERMFPDPGARPSFHALDAFIRPHLAIMLEMTAKL
jgi:2-iminobutanoate/2-iminopropanoate deaminase